MKNEKFAVTQQLDTPTQVLLTVVKMVPREDEAVQMLVQISDLNDDFEPVPFEGIPQSTYFVSIIRPKDDSDDAHDRFMFKVDCLSEALCCNFGGEDEDLLDNLTRDLTSRLDSGAQLKLLATVMTSQGKPHFRYVDGHRVARPGARFCNILNIDVQVSTALNLS